MKFRHALFVGILLLVVVFCVALLGGFQESDTAVYDFLLTSKLKSKPYAMTSQIVPVDINDRAERNLGRRLETRESFVDVFSVLSEGGLPCAMDFLFSGSRIAEIDTQMTQVAQNMGSLVMAIVPLDEVESGFSGEQLEDAELSILRRHIWHPTVKNGCTIPKATTFLLPQRQLAEQAHHLGHVGVTTDSDGIFRRVPLFYRWEDGFIPSMPLVLAAENLHINPNDIEIDCGRAVTLATKDNRKIVIPVDQKCSVLIPYPSFWRDGWKRIPFDQIADAGQRLREGDDEDAYTIIDALDDCIIVADDITTAGKDFGRTPFESVYPLAGIHTAVLNSILTNNFVQTNPLWLRILFMLLICTGCVFLMSRKSNRLFYVGFPILILVSILIPVALWFFVRIYPFAGMTLCYIVVAFFIGIVSRLLLSHEQKKLLQNALSRYFPRALAERILIEKRTDLKPADKFLTILFSDIAGFTKWSSDKTPETVHAFLSDYLESMAEIIFANGGTVDKFIGDGILAFFGDPFDQSDHAERALRTAISMQQKVKELRNKWQPVVGIDLKIRIGINSGNVIVGNLGTKSRIDYTVIGSAVNLASRMESNAPVGGILVTSETFKVITAHPEWNTHFSFGTAIDVSAKGYTDPVKAYVLL